MSDSPRLDAFIRQRMTSQKALYDNIFLLDDAKSLRVSLTIDKRMQNMLQVSHVSCVKNHPASEGRKYFYHIDSAL